MRRFIYAVFFLLSISCSNSEEQNSIVKSQVESEVVNESNESDFSENYTELDTVYFTTERGDTNKYEKTVYNQIVDKHAEFFLDYPDEPELSYHINYDFENFGSEAGKDHYFILYAYFLKKKNGEENLKNERNNLIEIYTHINSLFNHFQYGGTYFGHQYSRILGFAEYSLFLMPKGKDEFDKTYDIHKQKKFYIGSLQQLIEDEISIDMNIINEEEKIERRKKLNRIVDHLDRLIADVFYLRRAQEFHYRHYENH